MLDIYKIYNSNNYGQFKILNYINAKSVEIEFLDTGYKTKTHVSNIRKGNVKDKLSPSVSGVGFFGEGKYKATVNGKNTKPYQIWIDMIQRCYCPKSHIRFPTYIGCTVSPIWLNFQNFAQWFELNYVEGYELGKGGNKVYSSNTCLFVSHKENSVKASAKHYIFTSPEGKTVNIYNLREFCRENGLCDSLMAQVAKGKANHHKQWTKHFEKIK